MRVRAKPRPRRRENSFEEIRHAREGEHGARSAKELISLGFVEGPPCSREAAATEGRKCAGKNPYSSGLDTRSRFFS